MIPRNKYGAKRTACQHGHSHASGVRGTARAVPARSGPKSAVTAKLPWPPIREYLDLFYAEGRTTAEIAALYGCAEVTLRQYRYRLGLPNTRAPLEDRFMLKVRVVPSGCWEWLGARMARGYGVFSCKLPNHHRTAKAHRISWEIANKASLLPGAIIMHSCDNPGCVNPAHLELGNAKENMRQCIERGRLRRRRGEESSRAVLSETIVREARQRFANGESIPKLSTEYGISYPGLYNAVRGRSWAWLD